MPRAKEFDEEVVLQKAMLLFWKKGYHDTSITDLIDFIGISNASIYNTFGGKKKLFHRAFSYYREVNFKGLQHFLTTQDNIIEGLRKVFDKIITDDCEDQDCKGCFTVNTTIELIPSHPEVQLIINENKKQTEKLFHDFLARGVQQGQLSAKLNLKVIATLLYTLMTGIRVVGKTKPAKKESKASVEAVLTLLS